MDAPAGIEEVVAADVTEAGVLGGSVFSGGAGTVPVGVGPTVAAEVAFVAASVGGTVVVTLFWARWIRVNRAMKPSIVGTWING